jgi:hypothetical protein
MKSPMLPGLVAAAVCGAAIAADEAIPSADTVLRELKAGLFAIGPTARG